MHKKKRKQKQVWNRVFLIYDIYQSKLHLASECEKACVGTGIWQMAIAVATSMHIGPGQITCYISSTRYVEAKCEQLRSWPDCWSTGSDLYCLPNPSHF